MDLTELNKKITKELLRPTPEPGTFKRHKLIADIIVRYYPDVTANILDIGGREGFLCDELASYNYKKFTVIDISQEAISRAKAVGYDTRVMNAEDIGMLVSKYDIVIASHVIEHCKNPEKIIEGALTLLNENGIMYIEIPIQPKEPVPTKWGHWSLFTKPEEVKRLFDDRWKMEFFELSGKTPVRAVYRKR